MPNSLPLESHYCENEGPEVEDLHPRDGNLWGTCFLKALIVLGYCMLGHIRDR